MLTGVAPHDQVRLTLTSRYLHHEIWVPFMTPEQLTAERVMTEVDRVVQSNDQWLFDDVSVHFIHAPLPVGGGRLRGVGSLAAYLDKKKCLIQIPRSDDNLCCARAIVTAKARKDNHPKWNSIRQGRKEQLRLAKELHAAAQVPQGILCGKEEWEKFQDVLGREYQLVIVSRDFFNSVVYKGPDIDSDKQLYLYHHQNHFSVITSMPAFVARSYYCNVCDVGYNNVGLHICKDGCPCCKAQQRCEFVEWKTCSLCRIHFVSDRCYQRHLTKGLCNVIQACADCGKVHHTYYEHVCGSVYCKVCKKHQPENHKCFIYPLKKDDEKSQARHPKKQHYIFYDFECQLGGDQRHIPNLCVLQKVCDSCMQIPMDQPAMCNCKREEVIFKGENTLEQVGEWLFSGNHKGSICIAHNSQGYDANLLLEYVHENGLKPDLVQNGKKILCM